MEEKRASALEVVSELKLYINENNSGKFSTPKHSQFIINCVERVIDIFTDKPYKHELEALIEKVDLILNKVSINENIEIQKKVLEKITKLEFQDNMKEKQMTYSAILQRPPTKTYAAMNKIKPKDVILVYGKTDELNNSDKVRKMLQDNIRPSEINIGIERVRNIGRGGLAIELDRVEDAQTLENCINTKIPNLITRRPKKRRPHVMIHSVPSTVDREDIPTLILEHNEFLKHKYTTENIHEFFKIKFNVGKKGGRYINWVVETSPELRRQILKEGKLNIDWSRCRVSDFCPVLQCLRCCRFGHSTRNCDLPKQICSHCTEDHSYNKCPKRNNTPICCNCKYERALNCAHNARSGSCPVYNRVKEKLINNTDYGTLNKQNDTHTTNKP
ncbi:uncharacterized protein LOC111626422 [Centruroides sculpturatus]|uniref:uncharacterized protein LOC111614052 n=1 Tax=Centruroides sculpturatus TaxID=218467 RepID=UPI000C6CF585|nr:uncharacterized protein LOC111614052 [Centruroides sculpturatus]XP_023225562.1 uncharacterized protein LOC111626422 [Centruroides sculpturatus]